jgi:hypothetical protein
MQKLIYDLKRKIPTETKKVIVIQMGKSKFNGMENFYEKSSKKVPLHLKRDIGSDVVFPISTELYSLTELEVLTDVTPKSTVVPCSTEMPYGSGEVHPCFGRR